MDDVDIDLLINDFLHLYLSLIFYLKMTVDKQ